MQAEAELWTTALFNRFLAGPLDSFLSAVGHPPADPAHPWENWITMEFLVVAIILVLFAILRSRLSVEKPGKLQLTFEAIYKFVTGQTDDAVEHGREICAVLRGAVHLYSVHESDRRSFPGLNHPP